MTPNLGIVLEAIFQVEAKSSDENVVILMKYKNVADSNLPSFFTGKQLSQHQKKHGKARRLFLHVQLFYINEGEDSDGRS